MSVTCTPEVSDSSTRQTCFTLSPSTAEDERHTMANSLEEGRREEGKERKGRGGEVRGGEEMGGEGR